MCSSDQEEVLRAIISDVPTDFPYNIGAIEVVEALGKESWKVQITSQTRSSLNDGGGNDDTLKESWSLSADAIDKPLARIEGYRARWNHNLYMGKENGEFDLTLAEAHWINDQTASNDLTHDSLKNRFAWILPGELPPEGKDLYLYKEHTMPGVSAARRSVYIVTHVGFAKKESVLLTLI